MPSVRGPKLLCLLALAAGCRTVVLSQKSPELPQKIGEPSQQLQSAVLAIADARLEEAERIAASQEKAAPEEAALIRLYVAERRHDVAAVHALATGPTGPLLRS